MRRPLLIRADADAQMGTGHLMRCLALAQGWQDAGGEAVCLTACRLDELNARLAAEGVRLVQLASRPGGVGDAEETRETARKLNAGWVILDGYHFSGAFQCRLRDDALRVLAVDDHGHAEHYAADLVLNQNLHANESLYPSRDAHTRLLLGTRFALLRREFWKWRGWRREIPEMGRKVLVTLGGSDPDGVTLKAVEALCQVELPGLEAIVVVGAGNSRREELEALVRRAEGAIRLRTNVTDMPELMAWADVAVAAGGTTTWERAFLGLPSLVVVLAENQEELAAASERTGTGWNLGPHRGLDTAALASRLCQLLTDREARAAMARRGPEQIDGGGVPRVLTHLKVGSLRLRRVGPEDCRLIWEWANEPATRAVSFSSAPIPWEQHQNWFHAKLNDPGCSFFLGLDEEGQPLGQVRFDGDGDGAVISVALTERFHGQGYGPELIRRAAWEFFTSRPIARIDAFIRTENKASFRAFVKAGFIPEEMTSVRGHAAHRLVLQKDRACSPN